MSQWTESTYLLQEQYRDAKNLNARWTLHQLFSTNQIGWHRWVFDQLPLSGHILELGCGPALLWRENSERIPRHCHIKLTDFSSGMITAAQNALRDNIEQFDFDVVDIQAIPYSDDTFDVVIANHMLYHVPDRSRALAEVRRVLRENGRFFAATLGPTHLQEMRTLVYQVDPSLDNTPASLPFDLVNGEAQLANHFDQIKLHRYDDALRITKAEPLVAYIMSTQVSAFTQAQKATLTQAITQNIQQNGYLHVTKETGLFEAWHRTTT